MPPQLTRLMLIFGLLIALYIVVRWVSKPESFYWYGHYRGAALAENASLPIDHSDWNACGECHDTEADENKSGVHHTVNCQICHGAGQGHVEEPTAENILLPEVTATCLICHKENHARPEDFPQIDVKEHSDGMECDDCHLVHNPGEFQ